jgi:hypothetical protein
VALGRVARAFGEAKGRAQPARLAPDRKESLRREPAAGYFGLSFSFQSLIVVRLPPGTFSIFT